MLLLGVCGITRAGTCRLPSARLLRASPGPLCCSVVLPYAYRANNTTQFIRNKKASGSRYGVYRLPASYTHRTCTHAKLQNPPARLLQEQVCSLSCPTSHGPPPTRPTRGMHLRCTRAARAHPWVTSTPSGRCCARHWSRGLSVAMLTSAWRAWAAWPPRPPRRQPRRRRWRGPA